jgi:hypothetical protein
VFGVIDLYGQAAQATVIDLADYRSPADAVGVGCDAEVTQNSATSMCVSGLMDGGDLLRFHHLHGQYWDCYC